MQRQHGEGPGRKKVLNRLAVMRARVRHGGDDADLRIGPAHAFDPCALPEPRALAVGGDQEGRFDRLAAAELHQDLESVDGVVGDRVRREHLDRIGPRHGSGKQAGERPMFDDMRLGAAVLELGIEAEEMRAQGRTQRTVGDLDRLDGLRRLGKLIPEIERG